MYAFLLIMKSLLITTALENIVLLTAAALNQFNPAL